MIDYFYLFLYKTFSFLLKITPNKIRIYLMKKLGGLLYFLSKKHQKIIDANLDFAYDNKLSSREKKDIGIAAFTNMIDSVFSIVKLDWMSKDELIENVSFEGEEIINSYIAEGRQFILVTAHYGNWELLSQSIAIYFNLPLVGVGRKLDSDLMDKVLKENRQKFNAEMVYKNGAMKGCIKAINQKKIVGILIDQSLSKEQSVDVDFFNHKTTQTPITSILSRKFGLDMIPAYISTDDYLNYTVKIYPPIKSLKTEDQEKDLLFLSQAQADTIEEMIKTNPKQWFWLHKRWKAYDSKIYER